MQHTELNLYDSLIAPNNQSKVLDQTVIGEHRIRDFPRFGKGNLTTATLYERKNTRSILSTYKARNFPSKLTESVETGFASSLLYPILDQSLMFQTTVTALLPVQWWKHIQLNWADAYIYFLDLDRKHTFCNCAKQEWFHAIPRKAATLNLLVLHRKGKASENKFLT